VGVCRHTSVLCYKGGILRCFARKEKLKCAMVIAGGHCVYCVSVVRYLLETWRSAPQTPQPTQARAQDVLGFSNRTTPHPRRLCCRMMPPCRSSRPLVSPRRLAIGCHLRAILVWCHQDKSIIIRRPLQYEQWDPAEVRLMMAVFMFKPSTTSFCLLHRPQ
jgi:hypothetical protein